MREAQTLECLGLGLVDNIDYFPNYPYRSQHLEKGLYELQHCDWECARNRYELGLNEDN